MKKKKKNIIFAIASVLMFVILLSAIIFIDGQNESSEIVDTSTFEVKDDPNEEARREIMEQKQARKEESIRKEMKKTEVVEDEKVESKEDVERVIGNIENELEQMNDISFE